MSIANCVHILWTTMYNIAQKERTFAWKLSSYTGRCEKGDRASAVARVYNGGLRA